MARGAWLAALTLGLLGVGVAVRLRRPSAEPGLPCAPEAVRVDAQGVASCPPAGAVEAGRPLDARALLGAGGKLDLNAASEAELAQVPGVGRALAAALVRARERAGRFRRWEDVDSVAGVGPAKLAVLRAHTEIR